MFGFSSSSLSSSAFEDEELEFDSSPTVALDFDLDDAFESSSIHDDDFLSGSDSLFWDSVDGLVEPNAAVKAQVARQARQDQLHNKKETQRRQQARSEQRDRNADDRHVASSSSSSPPRAKPALKLVTMQRRTSTPASKQRSFSMPSVIEDRRLLKVKMYPSNFKKTFDHIMKEHGVEFSVSRQIRTRIRRVGIVHLGTFWYVAWQFIFAYVCTWPNEMLARCASHLSALAHAQGVALRAIDMIVRRSWRGSDDSQFSAIFKDDCGHAQTASPPMPTSTLSSTASSSSTKFEEQPGNVDYPVVFAQACETRSIAFNVHAAILKAAREQHIASGEKTWRFAKPNVECRARAFEVYWMFIYAIVERAGEMYLKKACLNGMLVQLAKADAAFQSWCAAHTIPFRLRTLPSVSPDDVLPLDVRVINSDFNAIFQTLSAENNERRKRERAERERRRSMPFGTGFFKNK